MDPSSPFHPSLSLSSGLVYRIPRIPASVLLNDHYPTVARFRFHILCYWSAAWLLGLHIGLRMCTSLQPVVERFIQLGLNKITWWCILTPFGTGVLLWLWPDNLLKIICLCITRISSV